MIPTYNSTRYLRETLISVLEQDPGPDIMQIQVVDNCSERDDPEALVHELGKGRVEFFRHPQNVGHIRNFNACLQRSRGHIVHLLHSDDCVRDGFYRTLQPVFERHPEVGAAFCRLIVMDQDSHWRYIWQMDQDESGIVPDWLFRVAVDQRVQYVSFAVRREVYERVGGFDERLSSGDDWELSIRIAANYPVWYSVEPLALHRVYLASQSGQTTRTGGTIREYRHAIDLSRAYLGHYVSGKTADHLKAEARENVARYALTLARKMAYDGDMQATLTLVREALSCSRSHRVLRPVVELFFWIGELVNHDQR
jgi:GT2 family glycosyltransferase